MLENIYKKLTLVISDAPIGYPTLPNETLAFALNERVTLTCDTNSTDANPECGTFIWMKLGDNQTDEFPVIMFTDTLTLAMDDTVVGFYTCQCRNTYGFSDVSAPVELVMVDSVSGEYTCIS